MRTETLPLSPNPLPYVVGVAHADGTVTLYELGDDLPADMIPPPPPPPPDLTARQIRLALTAAGLRDAVEAAVSAGGRDLRDWWEYSATYERYHPLVADMCARLGITPDQADAVWRLGGTL